MLHTLNSFLAPAMMEKLVLVINHVLSSETVATERLKPHAGRSLALSAEGWPALLPALPNLAFTVTPAGLLEWCGPAAAATPDLSARVDASNPAAVLAKALAGDMPPMAVEGDAAFAADVNWLVQNLRWDVAADLERVVPPAVAQTVVQVGQAVSGALRNAMPTFKR
jgi:ubiquinone biosynthesis protein UbiJ